jgi:hypothetical protein
MSTCGLGFNAVYLLQQIVDGKPKRKGMRKENFFEMPPEHPTVFIMWTKRKNTGVSNLFYVRGPLRCPLTAGW